MAYPQGSAFTADQAAAEALCCPFLFARAQSYLGQRDFTSAAHLAERLRASLEEQRERAATSAAATADQAEVDHARLSVASLTLSLEAVAHLLASCAYGLASRSVAPVDPGLGGATTNAGGASYAYRLLREHHAHTRENQLFFARACFELARYGEAEQALLESAEPSPAASSLAAAGLPDVLVAGGAQGFLLLGKVCAATGRTSVAASWLRRALEADPLCWSAWADLCHLGEADEETAAAAFTIDLAEFEASVDELSAEEVEAPSTPVASDSQQEDDALNPLLNTPSTRLAAPLRMLSLATPTHRPGQPLFTPMTAASATRPPPPTTGSFLTPPQQTPPRGGAKASSFASPPTGPATAMKPRGARHVRASSTSTPAVPLGASSAAAPTTGRRKVSSRLQWESTEKTRGSSASSSSFVGGLEYPEEVTPGPVPASVSERERNEKKLGRRVNRSATLTPQQVKTPRGPDQAGPTTPRRTTRDLHTPATSTAVGASATRPSSASATTTAGASAQRVTPAQRRAAAAGPPAVAPRKRLPEIAESATPESFSTSASATAPSHFSAHSPITGGTNLLNALQTPLTTPATTVPAVTIAAPGSSVGPHSPFVTSRHSRARSQPASAFLALQQTPMLADDEDEPAAPAPALQPQQQEDDAIMVHADEEEEEVAPGGGGGDGQQPELGLRAQVHAAAGYLTSMLQTCAAGYRLQHFYACKESISVYSRLPWHQFHTPTVFASVARCYFDLQEYGAACRFYGEARSAERSHPHTLVGMDVYSTALWHLGDAAGLSSLALWCMEVDALASESWVVVGNVFSLQKEHELALKFFRRAIQCRAGGSGEKSPRAAYAYTLSAHEYMANEDFERAAVGYRLALSVDARAYNAWYGLGNLYLRQEKYSMAAYHFRRAISIHPQSSVLHCYLGMTLHEARQHAAALEAFETADRIEPNNPLAKYHMAHVHLALGNEERALAELRVLTELAPREANVHFLMGKIQKKMGNLPSAMLHFVTALDLDPKDRTQIKSAIDHLHSGNLDDEDEQEI